MRASGDIVSKVGVWVIVFGSIAWRSHHAHLPTAGKLATRRQISSSELEISPGRAGDWLTSLPRSTFRTPSSPTRTAIGTISSQN